MCLLKNKTNYANVVTNKYENNKIYDIYFVYIFHSFDPAYE